MSSNSKYKLYQIYTSTDNINWTPTDRYEADLLEECSFECGCEPVITARTYSIVPSEQTVNVDCDVYKYTFDWTINETDYWNNGDITTTSFTTSETVKIGINITDEDKTHTGIYTYEDATANWTIIQSALDPCYTVVKERDDFEEHEDYIQIYNIDRIPSSWGRDYQSPNTIVEMVKIGNCVTEIDSNAFKYWTELTSVTIPDSVTSIGGGAFNNCYKLNSVEIPNSVTYLGNSVFSLCSGLTSVVLPTSIDYVPFDCFYDCFNLTSITIPNNYTSIRGEAFAGCWNLSSITLSENIEVIYDNAFEACKSITSLTLPNSVTQIGAPTMGGYKVFANCSSLTELVIPSGVSEFNTSNVSNCSSLTSLTFNNPDGIGMTGESFTNIGYNGILIVNDCSKYINVLDKLIEFNWTCNGQPIKPVEYAIYPTTLSLTVDWATTECEVLYSSITIDNHYGVEPSESSVTRVDVEYIQIEENTSSSETKTYTGTFNGYGEWSDCVCEYTITQTPKVESDCDTVVWYTDGSKQIFRLYETPYAWLSGDTTVQKVKFGKCLNGTGSHTLSHCPNLVSVEFATTEQIGSISTSTLASCNALTSVTFNSIQPPCNVGQNVFYMFSAKPVESFSIYVPSISIDAYKKVFTEWYSNNYIKANPNWKPSANTQTVFTFENGTTSAITTTAITHNSVLSYANATEIYIGDACTRVSTYAFQNYNNLKKVTVGSNSVLSKFDDNCFEALHLESMYMYKPTPPEMTASCYYNFEVDNVYVPSQYVDNYKNAAYWRNFNIISI